MKPQLLQFLVILVLLTGCKSMDGVIGREKLDNAIAHNDEIYLQAVIDRKAGILLSTEAKQEAADALKKIQDQRAQKKLAVDNLKQLIKDADLGKGDGKKLVDSFESLLSMDNHYSLLADYGFGLAKLAQWDFLFTAIIRNDPNTASQIFSRAEGDGLPIKAELYRFLKSDPFTFEDSASAFNYMIRQMVDRKWLDAGDLMTRFMGHGKGTIRSYAIWYDLVARYTPAHAKIVQALGDDNADVRTEAATALAELGDAKDLEKLETVADYDQYYKVVEENGAMFKEYTVREAANTAIKKIKLRA